MLDLVQVRQQIQALDRGEESSKRQAIHALRQHKEQEWEDVAAGVIQNLVSLLQEQLSSGSNPPSVRQEVATVLGNIGSRSEAAIPQLVELLQEGNPDALCEAAVIALGKIGKPAKVAVGQLAAMLANRRPTLVIHVVRALSDIGCADHTVQTALVNLWMSSGESQKTHVQVAIALCKLKISAKGLLPWLTSALVKSQDSSLRQSAAEALAWCSWKEPDVVPAILTAALHDKHDEVRNVAEAGLVRLGLSHDEAIDLCAKQLLESPYAEAALRNSGQPAVPALIGALKSNEWTTREKAARILGCFGELAVDAAPALKSTLRDKDLNVRLAAGKSLWKVTHQADDVITVLADLLEEKWASAFEPGEPRRRFLQSVIESLGRIGPPAKAAIPALTSKTKDKNRLISESALTAIKEIAPPVVVKTGVR